LGKRSEKKVGRGITFCKENQIGRKKKGVKKKKEGQNRPKSSSRELNANKKISRASTKDL